MKRLLIALLIITAQVTILLSPVFATTASLAIIGEGAETSGTYIGGAGTWANLNSDDGDTTYLKSTVTSPQYHCYDMAAFAPSYLTINSVTLYVKSRSAVDSFGMGNYDTIIVTPYVRISGTRYEGTGASTPSNGSYYTFSKTWTTNPATGLAWTAAVIDAAEFGLRSENYGISSQLNTTYLYVSVDYSAPTAPVVTTQAVTSIAETTATGNGNVTSDGGSAITERGTVISTSANPTTADHKDTAAGTTGAYTTSITGLTKGTLYHVRAYAINAIGTGYGTDVSFTTLTDPTISTVAASQVAATTARLNSNVTFDGHEACTVTFVYTDGTGFANYAAIDADGDKVETAASGTYTTGRLPYIDITSLATSTTYSFAVKITNSVSTAYGSVLTFTTSSGISEPDSLTAIPYGTSVSLIWPKGAGSTYSLLRYSSATYPTAVTSDTLGYLGTGNSVEVTGLTEGTTYYWSIWGMSGGTYSDNYTTALCTTLAYDTAVENDIDIETPAENDMWMQSPDTAKLQNIPMLNAVVAMWEDSYSAPDTTIWYFIWFMVGIGGGIVLYNRTSYNLVATFGAELIWFGIGAVVGLLWLWIIFVLLIIAMGFTVFGHRH